nr:hypothetical protein [Tanacetum cinerariifolium]
KDTPIDRLEVLSDDGNPSRANIKQALGRFSIVASSSVLWIYLGQFWHTLKEDGSKYKFSYMLERKELTMTLDDFRTIFYLPQATENNHDRFIPAPKFSKIFTKLIVSHYMTAFPKISKRARNKYHNLEDDEMVKSIFNSGKNKAGVGMKIPSWMITYEMKLTENSRLYAAVFGVDFLTTQSQPIESTQGMHRKIRASRTPNPDVAEGKSKQKSYKELEAKQNKDKVKEHLMEEEIKKLVEGIKNLEEHEVDSSTPRKNDNQNDPELEEEESAEDDYKLKRREKAKHVEESRNTPSPTTIRSSRIHSTLISLDNEKLQELAINDPPPSSSTPSSSSLKPTLFGLIMERQHNQADVPKMIADAIQQDHKNLRAKSSSPYVIHLRNQNDPHDDDHPEGENIAKRQKMFKHGTYVFGESSSGQDNESEQDDDELPIEKVSQKLVEEILQTVDEAKLHKVVNEMLRQQCTSGDEHQYHINQMQSFLKNDIVVKHWKNPHAKIFYIKKQKELRKPKEVIYSNSKIVQTIKTYWELRHEHEFITKIIVRTSNGSIVSITESDYKNLNKNVIDDLYLLIVNVKVDDYAETILLWSLSIFIRSIEKYKVFSIVSEPVYGIRNKNNKKEKRVMTHQAVHKICDATLKRVLEGLKSYNKSMNHSYVTLSLSKEDVEYLQLFE